MMKILNIPNINDIFKSGLSTHMSGIPGGFLPLVILQLLRKIKQQGNLHNQSGLVFVASNERQMEETCNVLSSLEPDQQILTLPAWDCMPYDRVSPSIGTVSLRLPALRKLARISQDRCLQNDSSAGAGSLTTDSLLVLTTASALVQLQVPIEDMAKRGMDLSPGMIVGMDEVVSWLSLNGFDRHSSVHDRGEFAVRGGILDLFAPGAEYPIRLDFFGDRLESIRSFDIASQRTVSGKSEAMLTPMSEVELTPQSIALFRTRYLEAFGAATRDDAFYQAISEGRRYAGMEHWLPLFYENLDNLFDYLDGFYMLADYQIEQSIEQRVEQIQDHFRTRYENLKISSGESTPYKPLAPGALYLQTSRVMDKLAKAGPVLVSPFEVPETSKIRVVSLGGVTGRRFSSEQELKKNVFETVAGYAADQTGEGRIVVIAAWSKSSCQRLSYVLKEYNMKFSRNVSSLEELEELKNGEKALMVLPVEAGFTVGNFCFVAEQDILGDRLLRKSTRNKKTADFISELSALKEGDLVVHADHGIGRFKKLRTLQVADASHDCLEIYYAGNDRLFLPVENIDLLSRYGSSDSEVTLDKLGGVAWKSRKARLKKNILEMAGQLISIAAERALRPSIKTQIPEGLYDEFSARFPYEETEDQKLAINAVLDDLVADRPMDRLICGDVGFGKTEVALRAAFVAAMNDRQVAVVVPTTLLARQHFNSFSERFRELPVNIAHASRLVGNKALGAVKKGLASGDVDIVIGTHALLGNSMEFKRLGLLIIDEEQRFGVKHKERLKELKSDIHVLTLSATPIPRTLQLALTGVRELSLITTAPLDRMAVRTFVFPFDPLTVREALLREHYRGGQSFYVCPRIGDLEECTQFLREHVPELKFIVAHGQMPSGELDETMNAFYDGQYDVLLSTTIVESGLDIPTANTLIVYRADLFGLAQLYQLRGRVGRAKTRAYALFALPSQGGITQTAERRLELLQSLDSVGAGFELASHDLDIRGSGNLLGDAQSGHVREVGYELYQQMLEEAIAELKDGKCFSSEEKWSPQISIGMPALIPESYVSDLQLRLNLYRRLAGLQGIRDIEVFTAELIDRFGELPDETDCLLKIIFIKGLCVKANIEKLDVGPRGIVIYLRNNRFTNPSRLLEWVGEQGVAAKIRTDQTIVLKRDFSIPEKRLKAVGMIVQKLAEMAGET